MSKNNWTTENIKSQKGKIVLITGANSGIGLEAASVLSQKEAVIIMAVRNLEKGKAAMSGILAKNPKAQVQLMQLDLSDLESVRKFSNEFHAAFAQLDILLNNAGIMFPPKRETTKQGFEMHFGTNHLGHFALTGLLFDLLKKTPNSRVVTQSSIANKFNADIHFEDLNWEKSYDQMKAYSQSKLANILFTYEIDRLLKVHKINSIATASHPGVTTTNLFRSKGIVSKMSSFIGQDVSMGALPILRAATEEQLIGAEYFGPPGVIGFRGFPKLLKSSSKSYNITLAKELWTVSEKLTGVVFPF